MVADLEKMKQLNAAGKVHAHNDGPAPELVIRLFETKPEVWRADLQDHYEEDGSIWYTIPVIEARERDGEHLQDEDLRSAITILGDFFYACDALKIQAGQEFGGYRRNRPPLFFLWWD